MILLSFRIRRPRGIGSVTRDHDAVLHTWCNLETDFVQVVADTAADAEGALRSLLDRFGPSLSPHAHPAGGQGAAVLVPCPADRSTSVTAAVERHGGLVQPPIVSKGGWDQFRVILFDGGAAPAFLAALRRLGEVEVVSKRPLPTLGATGFFVASAELLGGLTRRQAEALVAAVGQGYYQEPRATTLSQVAGRLGLGRASLEEHLRKAENKVLRALGPLVAMRATELKATQPRGRPFAGKRRRKADVPRGNRAPRAP